MCWGGGGGGREGGEKGKILHATSGRTGWHWHLARRLTRLCVQVVDVGVEEGVGVVVRHAHRAEGFPVCVPVCTREGEATGRGAGGSGAAGNGSFSRICMLLAPRE